MTASRNIGKVAFSWYVRNGKGEEYTGTGSQLEGFGGIVRRSPEEALLKALNDYIQKWNANSTSKWYDIEI